MKSPFTMLSCSVNDTCEHWKADERNYTVPEKVPVPSLQELNEQYRKSKF